MKRYRIPKYLIKRKIELLRRKIITRKFGYLFYRRTVSTVLPSEALRHHKKRLMRTHFETWYHVSIGWKCTLRAQIHYDLKIVHLYFKKWREFCTWRRREALKRQKAIVYYENNWGRLEGRWCLQKWKIFKAYRKYQKERLKFAWNHFKKKNPDLLRPYFNRWVALVNVSRKAKRKMLIGVRFYNVKVLSRYFKLLLCYTAVSKLSKRKLEVAIHFHQNKLLCLGFQSWKLYCSQIAKEKMNFLLAQTCYSFKLEKFCLKKLIVHTVRQKFLKQVHKALERLLLKKCLKTWVKFMQFKQFKREQLQLATAFAINKKKKAALRKLAQYVQYRKRKLLMNNETLRRASEHLKKGKINFYFQKWKFVIYDKKIQAAKFDWAAKYYTFHVKKVALSHWKTFTSHKRHRKAIENDALRHYNIGLLKLGLRHFKEYVLARKLFKTRIEEAKQFYKTTMIQEAIKVIMLTGIQKKQQRFRDNIAKISRELFIAQKYLEIWKSNTIYKVVLSKKDDIDDGFCDIGQDFCPNPDWFQMCFMLPRVYNSDL